jgi:hypothetical protein
LILALPPPSLQHIVIHSLISIIFDCFCQDWMHIDKLVQQLPALMAEHERVEWFWEPYTTDASLLYACVNVLESSDF